MGIQGWLQVVNQLGFQRMGFFFATHYCDHLCMPVFVATNGVGQCPVFVLTMSTILMLLPACGKGFLLSTSTHHCYTNVAGSCVKTGQLIYQVVTVSSFFPIHTVYYTGKTNFRQAITLQVVGV